MSFATEVKKELLSIDTMPCCKDALVAGILQGNSEIVLGGKSIKLIVKSP